MTDLRRAYEKAARQRGVNPRSSRADWAEIEAAVIRYQQLFGGAGYHERLVALRQTAVKAMNLLAAFEPRLVGAVVSGAITESHRVQLHVFADKPETLDLLLDERRIAFDVSERRYRYADGREIEVPVLSFGEDENGVDVAVFAANEIRPAPLSPVTGAAMKRLTSVEAKGLLSV